MNETAMKDDKIYAFPDGGYQCGQTLRDYFAAKIMQSLVIGLVSNYINKNNNDLAKAAYDMADAMMEERTKGEKNENA